MAEVNWQEMLQGLAEDRKRRDEEIEGVRVRREAEIVEERRRRDEENVAREAAMSKRLEEERRSRGEEREAMRNQMEQLAKMVERSVIAAGERTPAELGIKLVALRDSDDIEAYLESSDLRTYNGGTQDRPRSMAPLSGATAERKGAVSLCGIIDHGLVEL
jgi:hypothetical protein